jgi:hypothetical protein
VLLELALVVAMAVLAQHGLTELTTLEVAVGRLSLEVLELVVMVVAVTLMLQELQTQAVVVVDIKMAVLA